MLFKNKVVITKYMSKKDYILIAGVIKEEFESLDKNDKTQAEMRVRQVINNLALSLALSLRVDNARFDDTRFLTACGCIGFEK